MSAYGLAKEGSTEIQYYITDLERKLDSQPGDRDVILQQLKIWNGHLRGCRSMIRHIESK